jgi:hypothetical protein
LTRDDELRIGLADSEYFHVEQPDQPIALAAIAAVSSAISISSASASPRLF